LLPMIFSIILIIGTTQTAYAGSTITVTVEKTTTLGNGIFTFDLTTLGFTIIDTCSINTQTQSTCMLVSNLGDSVLVTERTQAGWMQDSTTCPGVLSPNGPFTCAFVNSPILAVGGTPIPIDTTMILLGATQTTASWMIPVIVAGIGIAIVITRKF